MIVTLLSGIFFGVLASPQASVGIAVRPEHQPFVDLAKAPMYRENEKWLGKTIDSVLPPSSVSRVLLLTAVTSATADLDAANIRRLLSSQARFEHPASSWEPSPVMWQAVIETEDGRVFQLRVFREWAQLISPGAHGFFRVR
jgi:hypothetical protein